MIKETVDTIILDHEKMIFINHNDSLIRNYQAIFHLREGLFRLAFQVRMIEKQMFGSGVHTFYAGTTDTYDYVNSILHWFSISIVNYLRLVALMELSKKNKWTTQDIAKKENRKVVKSYCNNYVKEFFQIYINGEIKFLRILQ